MKMIKDTLISIVNAHLKILEHNSYGGNMIPLLALMIITITSLGLDGDKTQMELVIDMTLMIRKVK